MVAAVGFSGKLGGVDVLAELSRLGGCALACPLPVLQFNNPVAFQLSLDGGQVGCEPANLVLGGVEVESAPPHVLVQGQSGSPAGSFIELLPHGFGGECRVVLKVRTRILQSRNAKTQYVTIPADMVADSQYPFKAGDIVEVEIIPGARRLTVQSASKKT